MPVFVLEETGGTQAPHFDLDAELAVQDLVRQLIAKKLLSSAHDVSEGGIFVSLLESAMSGQCGFAIETMPGIEPTAFLFGEGQGRIAVSCREDVLEETKRILAATGIPFFVLGKVEGKGLSVNGLDFGDLESWSVSYQNLLDHYLETIK